VIVWFGLGGHECWLAAGERGVFVRSSRSWRWLVPSVIALLEAREKRIREEVARLRAALGDAECALQQPAAQFGQQARDLPTAGESMHAPVRGKSRREAGPLHTVADDVGAVAE
jgi:hypothetical protein